MLLSLSLLFNLTYNNIPLASDERISEFPQKNTNFIHNIYCRRRRLVVLLNLLIVKINNTFTTGTIDEKTMKYYVFQMVRYDSCSTIMSYVIIIYLYLIVTHIILLHHI